MNFHEVYDKVGLATRNGLFHSSVDVWYHFSFHSVLLHCRLVSGKTSGLYRTFSASHKGSHVDCGSLSIRGVTGEHEAC